MTKLAAFLADLCNCGGPPERVVRDGLSLVVCGCCGKAARDGQPAIRAKP